MAFDKARVLQILRPAFALLPEVQKPDRKVSKHEFFFRLIIWLQFDIGPFQR